VGALLITGLPFCALSMAFLSVSCLSRSSLRTISRLFTFLPGEQKQAFAELTERIQ
jgi:hypothetical protein